jgi:FkbM family methyltransferase
MAPYVRAFRDRVKAFFGREEVRRAPVRAIARRVAWRAHWWFGRRTPIVLDPWAFGLRIALPRTGTAALVYYDGFSDRVLASEIVGHLAPGATYVEVGAHIGEYVLCAAAAIGPQGRVFAFEPNPALARSVEENARLNGLANVTVLPLAVGAWSGQAGFVHDDRSGGGWLALGAEARLTVETICLDDFARRFRVRTIDLLKVDAAGAETHVLAGAHGLVSHGRLPLVIAKLYNPAVARERFALESLDLIEQLLSWGYRIEALTSSGRVQVGDVAEVASFADSAYTTLVVARRSSASP